MTYTDLLGIGGLIDSQGEYVDAYWRMGTWFETFVWMPVTLVIQVKGLISLYEWFRLLVYYRKVHSDKLPLVPNVRRYVALAQSRGGACFCTRGAVQGYDVDLCVLALAKTVTPPGGPRREPGRPAPPLKFLHFDHNIVAVQKPMTYTDLLEHVFFQPFNQW